MNYLEVSREQILITIGLTAVCLWIVTGIGIFAFHLPLIALQLDPIACLEGLCLGISITGFSLLLHRLVLVFRESAEINLKTIVAPLEYEDLIWLGILPGLSEEMLFRGVLLPTIGLNWIGICMSSLIFGVLHLSQPRSYSYAIWAVCVGMMLSLITVASHNLLPAVVAHTTTNILAAWLWKLHLHQS